MIYPHVAEQIESLQQQLSQLRRQGCTGPQALDLLAEALSGFRAHLQEVAGTDAARRTPEQREQRYRSLFDYNLDAVFNLDQQVRLSEVNPAALQLTGYSREELLGMPILQLVVPGHQDLARAKYEEALYGRPADLEVTIAHKDGRQIDVYVTGGPIKVHGQVVGVFGIARDVTQAKRNHAEIRRLNEQLERRVAERTASLNTANTQLQAQIAERQQIEHELRQSETKYRSIAGHLQALASELILAEERERRRIAVDLHDDLGQKIALARIRLAMLKRAAAGTDLQAPIAQLLQVVDEAMESSRSLTFQICPPALYDLGLLPAAEWLVEDMQQRFGLHVQLVDDGQPAPMDERVRVVLFRCLRELLINVAKHSGVSEATVTIRCQEDTIQLAVADKGCGFDMARAAIGTNSSGFGLFSIQERLGYLGGAVQIRSAPGEGTTITLQVPARLADPSKPEESP